MRMLNKNLLVMVLLGFTIPQISFAAWWNPLTWFRKAKPPVIERVENKIATSTTTAVAPNAPKEVLLQPKKQPVPKQQSLAPIKQVADVPTEKKNNVVSLPNGAVVEMDEKGNITRTIKEAPAKTADD